MSIPSLPTRASMRRVITESPYAANTMHSVADHVAYAQDAMRDCLNRGEAPFASHLLYPQALNDDNPAERTLGIAAGLAWAGLCDAVVVYIDLGVSRGMREAIDEHLRCGRVIEYRTLPLSSAVKSEPARGCPVEQKPSMASQ
jgi:hypothetical protein